jgi:hypothetical protein
MPILVKLLSLLHQRIVCQHHEPKELSRIHGVLCRQQSLELSTHSKKYRDKDDCSYFFIAGSNSRRKHSLHWTHVIGVVDFSTMGQQCRQAFMVTLLSSKHKSVPAVLIEMKHCQLCLVNSAPLTMEYNTQYKAYFIKIINFGTMSQQH